MSQRVTECPACGGSRCYRHWCFRLRLKIVYRNGNPCYGYYENGRNGIREKRLRGLSAKSDKGPQAPKQSSFEWTVARVHDDPTA